MDTGSTCLPNGVTQGQMVRVVAYYIDARPARQHEDFTQLTIEALRAAWPCRR
jgi:Rap1a immunity proteins